MFKNCTNKYQVWYMNIINRALSQDRKRENSSYEMHHIYPKSIFPEFANLKIAPWNGVLLTAKEHFICHMLLCKAIENTQWKWKMISAFRFLSSNYKKTSRSYSMFKEDFKAFHPLRGISKSESHKANMTSSRKNNPKTIEACRRASLAAAAVNKGKIRPNHGKLLKQIARSKYTVHTPYGIFHTTKDCCLSLNIDYAVLKSYLNGKIVNSIMVSRSKHFSQSDIGENTNDLGWYQVPKAFP